MKFSIITPSYNQGQFIEKTFKRILDQKINFNLEYILIDAVSTDDTANIVRKYKPKFLKAGIDFVYICEKDKGQSDAINKGWGKATGDILTYINSDDYYEPRVLDQVVSFFEKNPQIMWAYGGWNLVNKDGELYKSINPKKYSKAKLLNYCNIGQPSCFFRRNLLEKTGFLNQDLHLAMDYDLWLKFAAKYPAGIIKATISNMRYYADAKSGARTSEQLKETLGLSKIYTKPLSWRRFCQLLYHLRGLVVYKLNIDLTRRISRKKY